MDNQDIKCLICAKSFTSERSLHAHIKAHKLDIPNYYQKYFPREDKFSHEVIPFKNKEQYFSDDFISRDNLRNWIISGPRNEVAQYMRDRLVARIQKKNLSFAPTQVELRTTMLPPIQAYNNFFGNYFSFCKNLNIKNRFKENGQFLIPDCAPNYEIYVDTREQLPLGFLNHQSEVKTLKFGDYACSNHDLTQKCYIERKSLGDFIGTLSNGYERLCREIDRSAIAGAHLIIVVESLLEDCWNFRENQQFYGRTKLTPEFIFHNVRDILQKYPSVQFLFVNGREEVSRIIEEIFNSNGTYQDVDLQFLYDINAL